MGHVIDLRHDAVRGFTDGERDVGSAQADVGQLTVGHAEELALGGADLEIGPDGGDQALRLTAEPNQAIGEAVGEHLGTGVASTQLEHAARVLAESPPRASDLWRQIESAPHPAFVRPTTRIPGPPPGNNHPVPRP